MNRRSWWAALFPWQILAQLHSGAANYPACAVCHTSFNGSEPAYALIVSDVADVPGNVTTLPNTRVLVCQVCGTVKVVAA